MLLLSQEPMAIPITLLDKGYKRAACHWICLTCSCDVPIACIAA